MSLFDIPGIPSTKEADKKILNKTEKKTSKAVGRVGKSLIQQINDVKRNVEENLGEYKEKYDCIRENTILHFYIGECIKNGIVAIDTETTGLNPMLDDIVGFSLYTPNQKAVYIPINHIDYITNEKVSNQISKSICKEELQRLVDNDVKLVMFNAKFDIRVLRHQIGVYMTPFYDGYLAQRCLNENEEHTNLKDLHNKYVLKSEKEASRFRDLFEANKFNLVPISSAYIYAARDAEITYELYQYQVKFLDVKNKKCIDKDLVRVASVFWDIEMPLINIVADMEDNGVLVDKDYLKKLSEKYNKLLLEKEAAFYKLCDKYNDKIEAYRKSHPNNKLSSMINIASSTQIAILLYDILGEKPVPRQPARGTGEEVLKAINNEFCKAILEYREVAKLISTYIDKMKAIINPNDGRVHCVFNQYGADTGRFSSQDPNMQNIPSHNKEIRKMFVAPDGYVLMSSDYSQQEPKMLALICKDKEMINKVKTNRDMYSEIAAVAFDTTYEECSEFYLDENGNKTDKTYPEGKERRSQAKSILLGILYGRGISSIAEQLHCSKEKAQMIQDKVFKGFPAIPKFDKDSKDMAREKGYVDTLWGRKRRLPDMQLPLYEFDFSNYTSSSFDPLSFNVSENDDNEKQAKMDYYLKLLDKAWGRQQKEEVKQKAKAEGIIIKDNGGFIAQAERQCVNARIQGSAGDMTKKAMLLIGNDEKLKELGFKLLIQVHDELIAECPLKNAKECKERFAYLMSIAAKDKLDTPIDCDVTLTKEWNGEPLELEEN